MPICHPTDLITFVAPHGMLYARGFSILGRNTALCMHRYSMSLFDVYNETSEDIIYTFVQNAQDAFVIVSAHLLEELLQLGDSELELPHGQFSLNMDDISYMISFICTT
jgi:hypothetical protein